MLKLYHVALEMFNHSTIVSSRSHVVKEYSETLPLTEFVCDKSLLIRLFLFFLDFSDFRLYCLHTTSPSFFYSLFIIITFNKSIKIKHYFTHVLRHKIVTNNNDNETVKYTRVIFFTLVLSQLT